MYKLLALLAVAGAVASSPVAHADAGKPTIVLVHGAFAGASSWNGVIKILEKDGYPVVVAANPLRGVRSDAEYIADIVSGIRSPVVLVGHSYGGTSSAMPPTATRTLGRWSTSAPSRRRNRRRTGGQVSRQYA